MESVFTANPNAKELLKFPDGTCFLNNSQGISDARTYGLKTKQEFEKITREESANTSGNSEENKKSKKK